MMTKICQSMENNQKLKVMKLTHSFPMHRKVFRCFQGVEKGCIGNTWAKKNVNNQKLISCIKYGW